ncbi:MAG: oxygenase MpaB family protein, partial [Solirubrobacterales bacterium]
VGSCYAAVAYGVPPRQAAPGLRVLRPRLDHLAGLGLPDLADAEVMFPPLPRIARPGAWIANRVLRTATIATMPRWMRDLAGLRQPAAVDAAIRPWMKAQFRIVHSSTRLRLAALGMISPLTRPVVEPVLRGIPPEREEVLTPAEAFERHEVPRPIELYARINDRAAARLASAV